MRYPSLVWTALALAACAGSAGADTVVKSLCTRPLVPNCITGQWGLIQPELVHNGPNTASNAPVLVPVADVRSPASRPDDGPVVAPSVLIDDGAEFAVPTRALIRAIRGATFNEDGSIAGGAERIGERVSELRKLAPDHQLALFVKTPRKLGTRRRDALAIRVKAINELLKRSYEAGDAKGSAS